MEDAQAIDQIGYNAMLVFHCVPLVIELWFVRVISVVVVDDGKQKQPLKTFALTIAIGFAHNHEFNLLVLTLMTHAIYI